MNKLDFFQRLDIYDINGDTVSKKTFDAVKEIQEQNKIFKEALEKISTDTVEVGFYVEPTWSAQIAREALAKVEK